MSRASTLGRIASSTAVLLRGIAGIPTRLRIRTLDRRQQREHDALRSPDRVPTQRERLDQLLKFYERYELLVETLCDAAQYGPEAHLEKRYAQEREWMLRNYGELRMYIVAYLEYEPSDAVHASELNGYGSDAFESLFVVPTLEAFLRCDDGHMISRIIRTRRALQLYADHLRQLGP